MKFGNRCNMSTPSHKGFFSFEMEKYKRFCICCCTLLKDKYRLTKTGRLTIVGEVFVTATQLSMAGEESLCRTCYLMVLNIQKVTENVDARTRTLWNKVSSPHALSSSIRASGLLSPLQPSPCLVAPSPARKKFVAIEKTELPQTMNTISRNSGQ